ncbi:hypothetical protein [Rhizomonospora bruguierae]|uniref:hypothetical protein n=1 Tax=Rhizomonospora bruguierae TaxID=1581705 RepID=UPI001BCC70BB|nr:hypothetical protein [Micromonospora sp. NBRC 107566]
MQMVLNTFLLDIPRAAGIWLALLVPALITLVATLRRTGQPPSDAEDPEGPAAGTTPHPAAVPAQWGREATVALPQIARRDRAPRPAKQPRGWRPRASAVEASRFAAEVAVAADRSAAIAVRRRGEWSTAHGEAGHAWEAYQKADAAARRVLATTALPVPRTPRTPAEFVDRERYLRRAAMAACWRRELSILQLSDALAHRDGWDPRRHPVVQEIHLRKVVRDTTLGAYRSAAARERAAWRVAEDAAEAARSLRREACTAAIAAWQEQYGSAVAPVRAQAGPARPPASLQWQTARAA